MTVSVVVPTRNRPTHAVGCVRSILATDGFDELIVVDQSDGQTTAEALSTIKDPRLRYIRSNTRGVTNARNLGIELSAGDVIAFTDDDCRVKPEWTRCVGKLFATDQEVAVVCGQVVVPPEIQHLGWAESFHPRVREWHGKFPPLGEWGITANLSVRRSVLARVGAFDPVLGAGAPLKSGGEPDFLFRVLRAGFKVINAEEVIVDHLGARKPGDESSTLIRGYGLGTAAAFVKHVRLGDAAAARIYLGFIASTTFRVCRNIVLHGRPVGAGLLLALLRGAFVSFRYPVDPERQQYLER